MDKKKYYVNLANQEISASKAENNDSYVIHANDEEVVALRRKLTEMHEGDMSAFFRSHVPIMPYHRDEGNDRYDAGMSDAFQIIYNLGDDTTKQHLDKAGLVDKGHLS